MLRAACISTVFAACTASSGPEAGPLALVPADVKAPDGAADCADKVARMRALFANGPGEVVVIYPADKGGRFPASSLGTAVADGLPVLARDATTGGWEGA